MTVRRAQVGEILNLRREQVEVEPSGTYREIGVRSFGRGLFIKDAVDGAILGDKRLFRVRRGDLVVSNVFAWEGAVAVAGSAHDGLIGSHRFMTWIPRADDVSVDYLCHYFASEPGLESLRQASPGSAGRNRTLSIKSFEAIDIPMPPIDEQRRIASQLDQIVDAHRTIDADARRNDSSFPPGALPRIVADLLDAEGLPRVRVEELVDVVGDTIHPGDDLRGAKLFIGLQHVEPHTGRRIGAREIGVESGRKFRFDKGDVTFGYLRPYLNKVWVADRIGLCSVEQFVLRPHAGVDPCLLGYVLRSASVLERAIGATNNLQLPRLSVGALMAMPIPDVRHASPALVLRLDHVTDRMVRLQTLRSSRCQLIAGILPAARNEIFSAMQ